MTRKDWTTIPMKAVYRGLYDGPHATPKPSDEGPIFLGIKNLTDDGMLDLSEIRHISDEDFPMWTRRVTPQPGDIVFTYEATLNRYALIPEGFRGCLGRRIALIRPDPDKIDARFLFYYFFGQEWRATVAQNMIAGSTVDRIPLIDFPDFEITIPTLPIQHKIAAILSAYDDFIENNARRIAILEEIAQNLYREWFVHYRFPGHESIPLIESDLGPVPEKWHVEGMSRIAKITRNGVNPTEHPDELFAHYSFPAFDANSRPLLERGESIRSGKYLIGEDSVLLSKLNPHIPRVWLPFPDPGYRPIASTEFLVLSARRPATRWYLYSLCSGPSFLRAFAALVLGTSTSHQRVKPQDFLDMEVVVPSASIIERFSRLVEPILLAVHSLRLRNDTLRRTRDLLIPRLISGQLDVSNLPIEVGEPDT